jgi:hypothetical protein
MSSISQTQFTYGTGTPSSTNFFYYWTPCRDKSSCTAGTGSGTALQQGGNCNLLAIWDSSVPAVYDGSSKWTITYNNGGSCNGASRKTVLTLNCGTSQTPTFTASNPSTNGGCEYDYTLTGSVFCAVAGGSGSGSSSSSGLSGGWVFIIILLVVMFLYCSIGYIYNKAKVHPESSWGDFKTNTPHLGFWCNIPKWTWAGCCVTKEFIQSKIAKKGDGHEPIASENSKD